MQDMKLAHFLEEAIGEGTHDMEGKKCCREETGERENRRKLLW